MGRRSCDSSTGHGDTGAWRYRYVGTQVLLGTWMHGDMSAREDTGARGTA